MLRRFILASVSIWVIHQLADALSQGRRKHRRRQEAADEGRWESEGGALRS